MVPGPVDQPAFEQIKAAFDSEVLFPLMPWELREGTDGRLYIFSARNHLLAVVYDPKSAHLMASAGALWLTLMGIVPMVERMSPATGRELIERLQQFLGMPLGGAPTCDAHSAEERGGR